VISQTISNYLAAHRRLVVPQLGTFIVKEADGTILFSELLRRDDGVLRGLLVAEGLNDLEAAGRIDRFVFEIRHAVQNGTPCPIEGLGVMRPGANGTIAFEQRTALPAHPAGPAAPHHTAAAGIRTPKISVSPKLKPEPCVRGLRYGAPRKDSRRYAYASGTGRRVDKILVVAIVAAIIAVAAIAFGYVRKSREAAAENPVEPVQVGWLGPAAPQNTLRS